MTRSWLSALLLLAVAARGGHADGPASSPASEAPDQRALRLLNQYRRIAGIAPVRLDAALSKGCMEHADYMRRNRGTDAMVGLNAHIQRPDLPGATPAGAACGKAADLFPGVADLGIAVDGWMAGIYHRRPMLDPELARIGVGYAPLPDGTLMAALMLVNADPASGPTHASSWPVAYPANQQTGVPLAYANEVPNPVPNGARGGYPVTLQFPPFDHVTNVRATLTDNGGKPVPIFLSDPEHPATSFGQYGVISVIAEQPLRPDARYNVHIDATWNGKTGNWSWGFATVTLHHVDADDESGIMAALGVASLVHGTVSYGGMMDSDTVFLLIGHSDGPHYKMVSVVIPIAVWRQLTRGAAPSTWVGTALDVETIPEVYENQYLNLPIATARQLHVLASPPH